MSKFYIVYTISNFNTLSVAAGMGDAPVFPGHLGHLTPAQEQALATFKANLTQANLYTPPSSNSAKPSHDEPTLL